VIRPDPRAFPERPPSEVEWEDLLVRVELGPRAVAVALEDAGPGAATRGALREALAGEVGLHSALEAMSGLPSPSREPPPEPDGDGREAVEALRRLRARSFAMVQRRGLEVWEWRQPAGADAGATAYQLLQAAAARDGALVAVLRRSR
jgi:hypothetical protein